MEVKTNEMTLPSSSCSRPSSSVTRESDELGGEARISIIDKPLLPSSATAAADAGVAAARPSQLPQSVHAAASEADGSQGDDAAVAPHPGSPVALERPAAKVHPVDVLQMLPTPAGLRDGDSGGRHAVVVATDGAAREQPDQATQYLKDAYAKLKNGLANCPDWGQARDLFYEAGSLLTLAERHSEAAFAFLQASNISRAVAHDHTMIHEVSFAADSLLHVDPDLAVDTLLGLSTMYARHGLFLQAAKCKKDAAVVLEQTLQQREAAMVHYKDAMSFYSGEGGGDADNACSQLPSGSKPPARTAAVHSLFMFCHNRLRHLLVRLERYDEASDMFLDAARKHSNGVARAPLFLFATLCALAKGSGGGDSFFDALYISKKRFDEYQNEDLSMQKGKENLVIQGILTAYDEGALHTYDMAVRHYEAIAYGHGVVVDEELGLLFNKCRSNLFEHLSSFM